MLLAVRLATFAQPSPLLEIKANPALCCCCPLAIIFAAAAAAAAAVTKASAKDSKPATGLSPAKPTPPTTTATRKPPSTITKPPASTTATPAAQQPEATSATQAQPASFNTPFTTDPTSGLWKPHNAEYPSVTGGYAVMLAPLTAAGLYPNNNGDSRSDTPDVAVAVTVSPVLIPKP
jgi:hypothetical protein